MRELGGLSAHIDLIQGQEHIMGAIRSVLESGKGLAVATAVLACSPTDISDNVPLWLGDVIVQLQAEPVRNPPAYIARYDYSGSVVYYLPPHCCDFPSVLWDTAGNVICQPDGGISGQGDGRCPDFMASRRNERIIWRDTRAAGS